MGTYKAIIIPHATVTAKAPKAINPPGIAQ